MTEIYRLVGLAELADELHVTKAEANAIRLRVGFPSPKKKFKMGPVWDLAEVLAWRGGNLPGLVSDPEGILTLRVSLTCAGCDEESLTIVEGSLQPVMTSEPSLEYETQECPLCGMGPSSHYVYIAPKEDA